MILSIFGKTLTAPRRKLAALPQKPAARPRRFLTPPRRLAPARHWARRVYRIFYALYGQWRASMCPTGALDCSVRGIPAMAAPNAYTLANERTARPPPAPPGGGCAQTPARRCAVDSPWSLWGVGQGVFQSIRFFGQVTFFCTFGHISDHDPARKL